jgi:hypothetical protein
MYQITDYTKEQAKKLGVIVKRSSNPNKKIDIFKGDKKVASVGAIGYNDYGTYLEKTGKNKAYADERRRLYKIRHKKDLNSKNGYWASHLLW